MESCDHLFPSSDLALKLGSGWGSLVYISILGKVILLNRQSVQPNLIYIITGKLEIYVRHAFNIGGMCY
jgi:hypothetical protein